MAETPEGNTGQLGIVQSSTICLSRMAHHMPFRTFMFTTESMCSGAKPVQGDPLPWSAQVQPAVELVAES